MMKQAAPGFRGTVLVAEIQDHRRGRAIGALETAGYVAVAAATADAADVVARRRPDAIVLGNELGDGDPIDLIRALRSDPLTADIPILHWTNRSSDPEQIVRTLQAGASMHLGEPITDEALTVGVSALLQFRDRQRELEVALSVRGSGIFDWAIPTGEVRWSPSLELVHGLEPGGFSGTFEDFMSFVHPTELERVGTLISSILEDGEEYFVCYQGVRADHQPLWIEGHGRVFRDLDGAPTKLVGVALDVTSREQNLKRLDELRRLAATLNTDDSKADVMATVVKALAGYGYDARLYETNLPSGDADNDVIRYRTDLFVLDLVPPPDALTLAHSESEAREQVRTIADLAVSALRRGWRYDIERETASTLQRAVLPARLPELDGWHLDAVYEATATDRNRLGGDFYDVVVLDDLLVAFIGDVSGHGLAATAQMSSMRNLLRTLVVQNEGDPAAVLGAAASLTGAVLGEDTPFVTTAIASIDRISGKIRYASAGHLPAVLKSASRTATIGDPEALMPPLGAVFASDEAAEASAGIMETGDVLVLYTDGVVERRDEPIDESVEAFVASLDATAVELSPQLVLDLTAGDGLNDDDRAVLCITRTS
ncbi:MAG: SpoIIE family protein phosphatase [Acidimicrobiales bacterium]|nr:SpoIIE family protein phosphatase [Acidimicrobiales bacterium]